MANRFPTRSPGIRRVLGFAFRRFASRIVPEFSSDTRRGILLLSSIWLFLSTGPHASGSGFPVVLPGADGRPVAVEQRPARVVSLVPSVTELIFAVGGGDAVVGATLHDEWPPEAARKPPMGGFFSPSPDAIRAADPELLFVSDLHREILASAGDIPGCRVVRPRLESMDDLYDFIGRLGRLFGEVEAAERLVSEIRADIAHIGRKIAAVPETERMRVFRFMGWNSERDSVWVPGDDSFQNAFIRLAGGIPPETGRTGPAVPVTLARWRELDPQIVYGCGEDRAAMKALLERPGWREVEAARNGAILHFPCDLTCRLSARSGHFVSVLAARLYSRIFEENGPVRPDGILERRPVPLDIPGAGDAEIVSVSLHDFVHRTLLIHFPGPMRAISTLEGPREGVRHAGNGHSPPQVWDLYHRIGLETSRRQLLDALGMDAADTALLFTGADMDRLSVQHRAFRDMRVAALVTAGVRSNAMRAGADRGGFYEPGTVNIILLTNMKLSPRAMTRAIVTATEAKTAALWDLDIRSAYTGAINPATGTGTDNILVVEGQGVSIDNAGGHTKMGELLADAVYAGVREAVFRQNALAPERPVLRRLRERGLSLSGLLEDCGCGGEERAMAVGLETLLLEPRYAGFLESALAIADHRERNLIADDGAFRLWCEEMAEEIAGGPIPETRRVVLSRPMPGILKMAVEALLSGLAVRNGAP